jgi:hypothetical protein
MRLVGGVRALGALRGCGTLVARSISLRQPGVNRGASEPALAPDGKEEFRAGRLGRPVLAEHVDRMGGGGVGVRQTGRVAQQSYREWAVRVERGLIAPLAPSLGPGGCMN